MRTRVHGETMSPIGNMLLKSSLISLKRIQLLQEQLMRMTTMTTAIQIDIQEIRLLPESIKIKIKVVH
jgi:hypothetical protein